MNASMFGRILWKEYRMQRGFWVSMALLTLAAQLFFVMNFSVPSHAVTPVLFGVGLATDAIPSFATEVPAASLFACSRQSLPALPACMHAASDGRFRACSSFARAVPPKGHDLR
jgi:hypothetical protein